MRALLRSVPPRPPLLLVGPLHRLHPSSDAAPPTGDIRGISAFMFSSKIICDDTYSNKSWCIVGQGMSALQEINQIERGSFPLLNFFSCPDQSRHLASLPHNSNHNRPRHARPHCPRRGRRPPLSEFVGLFFGPDPLFRRSLPGMGWAFLPNRQSTRVKKEFLHSRLSLALSGPLSSSSPLSHVAVSDLAFSLCVLCSGPSVTLAGLSCPCRCSE